ncbi:hypothetical protein Lal_00004865 [Lupinus albus]|uniref:DUF7796 domain-containing protein n=1 Tax=Lupinus albus TaxID=3870 RepID=A0A6A5LXQ0_LUPAL|nr:hypothetical protein Lalb_Chr23g0265831 [Lupinus albus]KAF1865489.1 hypothetical protein Lal_00004865 [Lupinus albus]
MMKMVFTKSVFDYHDWRFLVFIIISLSLIMFFSVDSSFSYFIFDFSYHKVENNTVVSKNDGLIRSKMAVCLVGGARRFELTGPSIMEMILKEYPNSDLFLHSPLDKDSFKFSLLKSAPNNVAAVKLFYPQPLPENDSYVRVLTAQNSPNGIQGLLQYFNLVEGCLTMIKSYQQKNNFTYDWIIRTRVDGYWNNPLGPENFIQGQYLVPPGSSFRGLNDRLGIGDITTSTVALNRLSLIPQLDSLGLKELNSESAFKAQLEAQNISYITKRLPFCVLSDRRYDFPPGRFGVPVGSLSSHGLLSGAKCRPCTPVCQGACVEDVMGILEKYWSWTNYEDGGLELCDARKGWEKDWENIFDRVAGNKFAKARKSIHSMKFEKCVRDFMQFKKRSAHWDAPSEEDICKLHFSTF